MLCDIGTSDVAAAGASGGAWTWDSGLVRAAAERGLEPPSFIGAPRLTGRPGCGSQTCLGMIWPVQWKPHSLILSLSAATLVTVSSYSTVTLFEAMLPAARRTPGIRPSCFSTAW
jgi:hypothetical protein